MKVQKNKIKFTKNDDIHFNGEYISNGHFLIHKDLWEIEFHLPELTKRFLSGESFSYGHGEIKELIPKNMSDWINKNNVKEGYAVEPTIFYAEDEKFGFSRIFKAENVLIVLNPEYYKILARFDGFVSDTESNVPVVFYDGDEIKGMIMPLEWDNLPELVKDQLYIKEEE